jgi:hypothetical protein
MANLVRMMMMMWSAISLPRNRMPCRCSPLHASPARKKMKNKKTDTKTSRQAAEGAVALPRKWRAKVAREEEIMVKTGRCTGLVSPMLQARWHPLRTDRHGADRPVRPTSVSSLLSIGRTPTNQRLVVPLASYVLSLQSLFMHATVALLPCLLALALWSLQGADCRYTTMYFYFCVCLSACSTRTMSVCIYRGGKPASREWLAGTGAVCAAGISRRRCRSAAPHREFMPPGS